MATVTEVVTNALQLLEVIPAETAITPAEAEDGLVSLNDLMNEWNDNGINIGYETLEAIDDILHVNAGTLGAIKSNLAVYIAPEYGRAVSVELAARAKAGKKAVRGAINLNPSQYPDTLPVGSGNEDNHFTVDGDSPGNLRDSRFYPSNVRTKCN